MGGKSKMVSEKVVVKSAVSNSVTGIELGKAKGAIEQFIYSCSHTLRGPLKSITGLVRLLKNVEAHPELDPKFLVQSIEKTVEKMEVILHDLEQFLSNSRQSIVTQSVEVNASLKEVLDEFQTEVEHHGIKISVAVDQYVPLYTDKNRFDTLLSQLISNAIHFRDEGKNKMEIGIRIKVTPVICTVHIEDNGIGINEEVLPHIFQLFYRGSERATGSGVGLYIVKEILNKMGGTISTRSTETIGTTFYFSIPNLCQE